MISKKYYLTHDVADEKISGPVYPQCYSFQKKLPKEQEDMLYSYQEYFDEKEEMPPFKLNLDGYVMTYRVKLTNFISHVTSHVLLMDKSALDLLCQFNIGEYQIIPTQIPYRKTILDLYFVYIVTPLRDIIDFPKCVFRIENHKTHTTKSYSGFKDLEEINEFRWKTDNKNYLEEHFETIAIKEGKSMDYDLFRVPFFTRSCYFMSEKLKNAIEEAGLTGLDFIDEINVMFE